MAVLSVETKKISELEAASSVAAADNFIVDTAFSGTQKASFSAIIDSIKDEMNVPAAATSLLSNLSVSTNYENSSTKVAAASQGYDLNNRVSVIERENNCIYGVSAYGIEWSLSDLLAKIRAEKFNDFAIGDYITANDTKWCVAAKYYWTAYELPNSTDKPHVVLMPNQKLGGQNYQYNSTQTNTGGYNASALSNTVDTTLYNALPSALRAAALAITSYESTKSGSERYTRYLKMPNERQVTGLHFRSPTTGACYEQLPLCKSMSFLSNGDSFWLLDPSEADSGFCDWRRQYQAVLVNNATSSYGVRPLLTIG